jgi:peptide/nickel transport system substrate-binding protein
VARDEERRHDAELKKPAHRIALTTTLLAVLLCAACRDVTTGEARPIEMLVQNDAETLDPRYVTDAVGIRTSRMIHAGLTRLDPATLAPIPYAAKSWTWRDATTLRVELRDDVRFHSGAPLRAADVVATIRAFASPTVASRHARVIDAIDRADVEGDAVVIRLKRAHATLLSDLELPILRADQAESPPDPRGALDGVGPYTVAHWERGAIALSPADGSVMPRPAHAVVVRTVHDENARALRLHAGRADVALNLVSPTLLPAMSAEHGLAVTARPGSNLTYLVVHESGPLASRDLRRAISLAIDRETIVRTLFGGHARAATSVIPPTHWAYLDSESSGTPLARIAFAPQIARALLRDAGTPRVHLSMLTTPDRLRLSIARVIAQELAEVGIDLEVVPLELGTLLARLSAGDFELASLQLPEFTEPHVLRFFLHSDFVPPAGSNRGRVADAELSAMLDEGGRTVDVAERRRIYARVDQRIREEMHIVPLWHEDQVAVTSARARSFVPSAEGRWLSLAEGR